MFACISLHFNWLHIYVTSIFEITFTLVLSFMYVWPCRRWFSCNLLRSEKWRHQLWTNRHHRQARKIKDERYSSSSLSPSFTSTARLWGCGLAGLGFTMLVMLASSNKHKADENTMDGWLTFITVYRLHTQNHTHVTHILENAINRITALCTKL